MSKCIIDDFASKLKSQDVKKSNSVLIFQGYITKSSMTSF